MISYFLMMERGKRIWFYFACSRIGMELGPEIPLVGTTQIHFEIWSILHIINTCLFWFA
jgi:hypothetical protein